MPALLASDDLAAVPGFLDRVARDGPAVLVSTAAEALPDGASMVERLTSGLAELGLSVREFDLTAPLRAAAAVIVGPGDPFHLLGALRRDQLDDAISKAVGQGLPYVGISAGAMVAGPSIEPLVDWSPFEPGPSGDRRGLDLVGSVVLAHRSRPDRVARVPSMLARFGREFDIVPLDDDQALIVDEDRSVLCSGATGCEVRDATLDDTRGIAETFCEAAEAAWSGFLHELPRPDDTMAQWRDRVDALGAADRFLVAEREGRIIGFVWTKPADGADAAHGRGLLETFYTRPEVWGTGVGRLLMTLGVDALNSAGFTDAVLWTEARNERPLAVYHRLGWRPDGVTRERDYLGSPIREVRLARGLV